MVETCRKHTLALVHHIQHATLLWNIPYTVRIYVTGKPAYTAYLCLWRGLLKSAQGLVRTQQALCHEVRAQNPHTSLRIFSRAFPSPVKEDFC